MVIVVTGASSGIGAATARYLARQGGNQLVVVARREARLRELADEIGATAIVADLTAPDTPAVIAKQVDGEFGRLDALVNNAGAHWPGTFAETGWSAIERAMELNFSAHVRLTEALLPLLRASTPSTIVNVGSVAGRVGLAGSGAYSASKFALGGWTEALYAEERRHGVHVALVLPGFVETEGFPHRDLRRRLLTRWTVSTEAKVAKAISAAVRRRTSERYVPRAWWFVPMGCRLTPGLYGRPTPTIRD
jgi:uncharacterized protein